LAICRGIQILNVALGGELIQHLEDVVGNKVLHQDNGGKTVVHTVRVDAKSLVAGICDGPSFDVASKHHQAVGRLAAGLRATAWTSDGIVEALEMEDHPEMVAVQWHPEETAAEDKKQQALFDWLIELSGKK
jgi:putative glutamine amidotransferase